MVPALVDIKQDKHVDGPVIGSNVVSSQRQQMNELFRPQTSKGTHLILWFNGPDYFSLEHINVQIKNCLFSNCICTADKSLLKTSSAVLFCTTCESMGRGPPLNAAERPPNQTWVIISIEPPHNHLYQDDFRHHMWKNTINWSMTYRLDSDILMPYGYLETRPYVPNRNYSNIFRRKTKFAAWIVSHCGASSMRDSFVRRLQGYGLPIDVYGKCGKPLKENAIQLINNTYKFYLSLENSYCKDYVTEKFFNYFPLDTIVIARGGAEYGKLLPNDSFIDASQFKSIKELVNYLLLVNSSEEIYTGYMKRKDRFITHKDYQLSFCDLCAKLNKKDENRRVYHDIVDYIYSDQCHIATDVTNTVVLSIILFLVFFLYAVLIGFKSQYFNKHMQTPQKLQIPNLLGSKVLK